MDIRILQAVADGGIAASYRTGVSPSDLKWEWIDVLANEDDIAAVEGLTASLGLDPIAVDDAVFDFDLPKVDDFGDHLHIVLHGLRPDRVAACAVSCFLTEQRVVTIHRRPSPSLDALYRAMLDSSDLLVGGADDVLAMMSDAFSRRHLVVLAAYRERVDDLVESALDADPVVPRQLMAIRADLAVVGHTARPQREVLDQLRVNRSALISSSGSRRFSDAFDVSVRVAHEVDEARVALRDILDVYRGAESAKATDISRVLTLYAALVLPLALTVGFFGMNFENLPLVSTKWGWIAAALIMIAITLVSVRIFFLKGWMQRLSGKTGSTVPDGLAEATRLPVEIRIAPNGARSAATSQGESPSTD